MKSKGIYVEDYVESMEIDRNKVVKQEGWDKLKTSYNGIIGDLKNIGNKYKISRYEDDKTFMILLHEAGRVLNTDGIQTMPNHFFYVTDETSDLKSVSSSLVLELLEEEISYIESAFSNGDTITIGSYLRRLNSKLNKILASYDIS